MFELVNYCNEADQAITFMNELPMFAYNLWMSYLCQNTSIR